MNTILKPEVTRIAMWSGPRNISTAMMRSWENRSDTFVSDEPFYAYYLTTTGIDHPGRDEIIDSLPNDWQQVANDCVSLTNNDCCVHYQKHMTQHMLPQIELDWIKNLHNIFLIRSPIDVVASYSKTRPHLTPEDLGFAQQHRLFNYVRDHIDPNPLVIASTDVLSDPASALRAICQKCGLAFNNSMLKWPTGKRESDGVWAPHWYHNVEKSTEFQLPASKHKARLNTAQQDIANQCMPFYRTLRQYAIKF